MPQATYQTLLNNNDLSPDAAQARVVDALQYLYDEVLSHPMPSKGFWARFQKPKSLKGLYIYGGVGRGKTLLMDLFYDQLPDHVPKRRTHFHEFMIETHAFLHQARGEKMDDILPQYATSVAKECRVLCFDEFHVTDVADAMILGRLFAALFEEGITIVTTSNRPPEELYKGGLQRDRFEPFVALMRKHLTVLHLDSQTDYRQMQEDADLKQKYFTPLGEQARHWANRIFLKLSEGEPPRAETIKVKGRTIHIESATTAIARLSFNALCEQPLGAEDYLALAEKFPTLLIEDIPKLGYDRRNEAKRFMNLIDVLYDKETVLYITADAAPDKLYRGKDHSFEFERTVSRLTEMGQE